MGVKITNGRTRFFVCEVTREDLESRGYIPDVDDFTMGRIASEMQELITSCDFWTALDSACDKCGVKKFAVT